MPSSRAHFALALASVALLYRASPASAGEPGATGATPAGDIEARVEGDSAEALIKQGIEFRRRREDRLALAAFERAWAIGGSPRALAQLALAEQALGLWREAFEHVDQALARTDDAWITAHQPTLLAARAEILSRLGTVELSCNVDGAEISVDGRSIGRTPLEQPLRLVAGKSVIQAAAEGYFDVARQVQVDAGGISRVSISLTPITAAPSPPAAAAVETAQVSLPQSVGTPPLGSVAPVPAPSAPLNDDVKERVPTRDLLMYTSGGLAALGALVGLTGYVAREVNIRDYNDDARCALRQDVPRSIECSGDHAAWRRGELIATIGASAAGVFGLTALYFWWSRPDDGGGAQLSCTAAGAAVICTSRF